MSINSIYNNTWVKASVAVGLSLLLAFEHDLHIFAQKQMFLILLMITVALIFTEFTETPGLVLLMVALTMVSFSLAINNPS